MPLSAAAGKAIGKLFRNLSNPRWLAQQATETAAAVTVINWAGQQVKATKKGKVVHKPDEKAGDVHVADIYHCPEGYDYLRVDGKNYRFDETTKEWYEA